MFMSQNISRSKFSVSPNQKSKDSYTLFLLCVQVEDYQNILKLTWLPLAFTSFKAFLKNKTRL